MKLQLIPGVRPGSWSLGYHLPGKATRRDPRFSPSLTLFEANWLLANEVRVVFSKPPRYQQ